MRNMFANCGGAMPRISQNCAWRLVCVLLAVNSASCSKCQAQSNSKPPTVATMKVYVASPLGFAESTRSFMNDELIPAIKATGANSINPWDADNETTAKIDEAKKLNDLDKRRVAWKGVVERLGKANAKSIEMADGVVAVLDGVDIDSGTAAEIGYATALGKWVIGYRGDFRRTGEDVAAEVNLQVEYFIGKNGGRVVHNLTDLKEVLGEKLKTRR